MQHKEIKFFVDSMFGNIAKKLRILGFDSEYYSDIKDEILIESAKKENRIIISRDSDLVKKAQKLGLRCIFVSKNKEIEQFVEIIKNTQIILPWVTGDTARCPKCNSIIENVHKSSLKECIPNRVFEENERFWKCTGCNQLYWDGTHITRLQKFVDEINERLQ